MKLIAISFPESWLSFVEACGFIVVGLFWYGIFGKFWCFFSKPILWLTSDCIILYCLGVFFVLKSFVVGYFGIFINEPSSPPTKSPNEKLYLGCFLTPVAWHLHSCNCFLVPVMRKSDLCNRFPVKWSFGMFYFCPIRTPE